MKPKNLSLFMLALLFVCGSVAQTYVIDGSISDWSINSSTLISSTAKYQFKEDQTGNAGTYLGPEYGGQLYDAEAIYVNWNSTTLYVGILTGMPASNTHNPSANTYGPGDIIFDFNYSTIDSNLGSTSTPDYALVTTSYQGLIAGNFYGGTSWQQGLVASAYAVAAKTGTISGTPSSGVSFAYSGAITGLGQYVNDLHYFIEASVPVSSFGTLWSSSGPTQPVEIRWGALCANDLISTGIPAVPEPSAYGFVMMSGILGFIAFRKWRKNI